MTSNFTTFLLDQAWVKVIRVLLASDQKRSFRELVDLSGLSLAGVQDVVRRLSQQGVIFPRREKNKLFFSLVLTDPEKEFLRNALAEATHRELRVRSVQYSKNRQQAVDWIDPQLRIWQAARKLIRGTA